MTMNRLLATAALVISVTGTLLAATPDQVGTWSGSVKIITYTNGTDKAVTKEAIQIEIAADNATTVTVGGATQALGAVFYNTTDGFIQYYAPPGFTSSLACINFKNNTMKGTAVGFTAAAGVLLSTLDAKYKLKKQ
jgi:hypothetical protein